MKSMRSILFSLVFLVVFSFSQAQAYTESLTTDNFNTVMKKAYKLGENYGASHVLLVFDIDNTLLAMNQTLGSDQWFSWQESLLKKDPKSNALVAKNFNGLLKVQGLLFSLSGMHLTDNDIPTTLDRLKQSGYPMLVITSRGADFDHATLTALKTNKLNFTDDFKVDVPEGQYNPYNLKALKLSGLTEEDVKNANLKAPRKVEFQDGVLFGAGQNKGILLKTLLAKSKADIKAIIFVDDSQKNVDAFNKVMKNSDYAVVSYRYSKEDQEIADFDQSDKKSVTAKWYMLNQALLEVFNQPAS